MHSSTFSVAGMSSSASSHSPNLGSWGTSSTAGPSSFSDSLAHSRSHYQSGYLMSTSQNNNAPQGSPRADEVPTVQTKAKINHMLSRGSATDFGIDSMFQSTRHRQTLVDEDAPPMSSVNDIPNESNFNLSPKAFRPKKSTMETSPFANSRRGEPSIGNYQQPYYVIVFGYPADKYSVAVEYFKSLGLTTEADPHLEIANCFKIGYYDAGDAMRVVRKNGEVLGGSFMIGVKWADPAQAEVLLSPTLGRSTFGTPYSPSPNFLPTRQDAMVLDEPFQNNSNPHSSTSTPSVGTPIRLAPSTSAFRQATFGNLPVPTGNTSQSQGAPTFPAMTSNANVSAQPQSQALPTKGLVGQAVDLIFGW